MRILTAIQSADFNRVLIRFFEGFWDTGQGRGRETTHQHILLIIYLLTGRLVVALVAARTGRRELRKLAFPVRRLAIDEVDLELLALGVEVVVDKPVVLAEPLVHVVDRRLPAPQPLGVDLAGLVVAHTLKKLDDRRALGADIALASPVAAVDVASAVLCGGKGECADDVENATLGRQNRVLDAVVEHVAEGLHQVALLGLESRRHMRIGRRLEVHSGRRRVFGRAAGASGCVRYSKRLLLAGRGARGGLGRLLGFGGGLGRRLGGLGGRRSTVAGHAPIATCVSADRLGRRRLASNYVLVLVADGAHGVDLGGLL